MIATAAEANPTCFSPNPLTDVEMTFIPQYMRLVSSYRQYPPFARLTNRGDDLLVQVSQQSLVVNKILHCPVQGFPRKRAQSRPQGPAGRHPESEVVRGHGRASSALDGRR